MSDLIEEKKIDFSKETMNKLNKIDKSLSKLSTICLDIDNHCNKRISKLKLTPLASPRYIKHREHILSTYKTIKQYMSRNIYNFQILSTSIDIYRHIYDGKIEDDGESDSCIKILEQSDYIEYFLFLHQTFGVKDLFDKPRFFKFDFSKIFDRVEDDEN